MALRCRLRFITAALILHTSMLGAQSLRGGDWTGITRPRNLPPVGAIFSVTSMGGLLGINLTSLSCMQGCPLGQPRFSHDTLLFSWTASGGQLACRLTGRRRLAYGGTCTGGRDTVDITMNPPDDPWMPSGIARYLLDTEPGGWRTAEHGYVRYYALRGSRVPAHLDTLVFEARQAIIQVTRSLQVPGMFNDPLDIFLVDSRADLQRLLNVSRGGYTDPFSRTVVVAVDSAGRSSLRHEIAHAVSWASWGPPGPQNDWLQEGFAVFLDWRPCRELDLDGLTGYLDQQGLLITTEALIGGFRDFDNSVTYIESGSLAGFIFDKYGVQKFRDLWHRGMENLTYVTGTTLPKLDQAWHEWIRAHARAPQGDWRPLVESGCQ